MCLDLSELYDAPRATAECKLLVGPLDEFPIADAKAVPPGHDIHCINPVIAVRAYFIADGGVKGLLIDPCKGFPNRSDLAGVVTFVCGAVVVEVIRVQHEEVVSLA